MEVFRALVPNLRFGPFATARAENFQGYKVTSTTATSTGEFSVEHGMGYAPYLLLPLLNVGSSATAIVPLTVTRPADKVRLYLKTEAGSTNKVFSIYLE